MESVKRIAYLVGSPVKWSHKKDLPCDDIDGESGLSLSVSSYGVTNLGKKHRKCQQKKNPGHCYTKST